MKYVHSDKRQWSCEDCPAKFKQKDDLRKHTHNVHNVFDRQVEDYQEEKEKPLYKCKTCNDIFVYKKNLTAHERFCNLKNDPQFECEEGGLKFRQKRSLVYHKKLKHGNNQEKFVCSVCGKNFNEKKILTKHETKHDEK